MGGSGEIDTEESIVGQVAGTSAPLAGPDVGWTGSIVGSDIDPVGPLGRPDGAVELDSLTGQRVSLRQRIGEQDGRPLFRDALGELIDDAGVLSVQTRRGTVPVDRTTVVAVRVVPAATPKRAPLAAVVRLESLCADAWPALVDEPLGAWRLRAAGGWTGRANSALAIGDPGVSIPAALEAVREFATRNGIGPRVQAPVGSPWDRAVAAAGWTLDVGHAAGAEVDVLVADLAAVTAPALPAPVEITPHPAPGWYPDALPPVAVRVLGGAPVTAFALVRDPTGEVMGRVRGVVVEDHLHLSMLEVVPSARGRGLATGLLVATAAWGRDQGARWGVLQVALHNTRARSLYARIGAVSHHRYRYLVPPG